MASKRTQREKRSLARQKPAPKRGGRDEAPEGRWAGNHPRGVQGGPGGRHEVFGTLVLGFAAALLMALVSWRPGPHAPPNLVGPAGAMAAGALFGLIGAGAYAAAGSLVLLAVGLFRRDVAPRPLTALSWLLVVTLCASLAHLAIGAEGWSYPPGGAVGRTLGELSRSVFGTAGSLVLLGAAGAAALVLATGLSLVRAATGAAVLAALGGRAVFRFARDAVLAGRDEEASAAGEGAEPDGRVEDPSARCRAEATPEHPAEELVAGEDARIPPPSFGGEPRGSGKRRKARGEDEAEGPGKASGHAEADAWSDPDGPVPMEQGPHSRLHVGGANADAAQRGGAGAPAGPKEGTKERAGERRAGKGCPSDEAAGGASGRPFQEAAGLAGEHRGQPDDGRAADEGAGRERVGAPGEPAPGAAPRSAPAIIEPRCLPRPAAPPPDPATTKGWTLPPISLLGDARGKALVLDRAALTRTAERLTAKLADFGISGRVREIRPGPVVTMYEFEPGPGIKVSRIANLADDLAMAMEALRVRIVAPIPGKGVVGIEVPNRDRVTVLFKEILEQDVFQKSASKLTMALGKDIEGMPYVVDLARMPHLLIAGTTGSGKSVSVNSMILSMLFKSTPDEVKFIMVDPKMLELSLYEGIPHLLLPVVTDAKKAALALRWAVDEMERRYQAMARAGVRTIAAYNKWVEEGAAPPAAKSPSKVTVVDVATGESREAAPEELPAAKESEPPKKLPYIVIIIDELADLMMVASREVETYIARLAQMARAAGLHLMVATQRPSTDVVTGVIKANFPARISFKVASRHDSATIINTPGAENLLGDGDMLILPPGTSNLARVHGGYVGEEEIRRVVDHWKEQGAPKYDMEILKPRAEDLEGDGEEDDLSDELYDQAIAAVSDMRSVSISLLQRKMRIGYNRAARMIERMERDGIVGPADGAKPREVLIRPVGEMPGA